MAGFDADPETLRRALEVGAVDRAAGSVAEATAGADVVICAAPVNSLPDLAAATALGARRGGLAPGRPGCIAFLAADGGPHRDLALGAEHDIFQLEVELDLEVLAPGRTGRPSPLYGLAHAGRNRL